MKFRKKPVVIEAVRWDGSNGAYEAVKALDENGAVSFEHGGLHITTLEGTMHADIRDWIIKGVKGELYPCKPDIFEATYEPVSLGEGMTTAGPFYDPITRRVPW
jgi:hypothetical protein